MQANTPQQQPQVQPAITIEKGVGKRPDRAVLTVGSKVLKVSIS